MAGLVAYFNSFQADFAPRTFDTGTETNLL
jgi:hypothetical protein